MYIKAQWKLADVYVRIIKTGFCTLRLQKTDWCDTQTVVKAE